MRSWQFAGSQERVSEGRRLSSDMSRSHTRPSLLPGEENEALGQTQSWLRVSRTSSCPESTPEPQDPLEPSSSLLDGPASFDNKSSLRGLGKMRLIAQRVYRSSQTRDLLHAVLPDGAPSTKMHFTGILRTKIEFLKMLHPMG